MRCTKLAIAFVAIAGAGTALAQSAYFVSYSVTPDSPAACNANGAQGTLSGSFTANLPNAANNAYQSFSINGGAPATMIVTISGPFPQTESLSGSPFFIPTPTPTPPPYTLVALALPAQNGVPVGTGTRIDVTCDAGGAATITFTNGVPAPAPVAVPAVDRAFLALLAGAVMLFGAAMLARRPRRT